MVNKPVRRLRKKRQKAVSVFTLMIVEDRDSFCVKEFVEESAAPPPLASITGKGDNAPWIDIHP
jgi:hypothetical protein